MDPNKLRKIDYFAGISLSFLFTFFDKTKKFLSRNKATSPEKILLIEVSEMGSIILAYPAIKKLKQNYPNSELFFLTFKKCADAIKILKVIPEENILTLDNSSIKDFFIDLFKILLRLRKERIDSVLDMELFARFSNLISYMSGAKNRVGFSNFTAEGLYRGDLLTHKVYYNPYRHISHNFLALVEALNKNKKDFPLVKEEIQIDETLPKVRVLEKEKQDIFNKLKTINPNIKKSDKIILFNFEAGDIPIREWPLANFSELGKMFLQDKKTYVVLIGTKKSKKLSLKIKNEINDKRCIDFTGKTSFKELIRLFSISDLMVSIDSGPPHFASLTGLKTIVLFGPETPLLYKPLNNNAVTIYKNLHCSPCLTAFNHRTTSCKNNKCLKIIKPNEVYKEAVKLLNKNNDIKPEKPKKR